MFDNIALSISDRESGADVALCPAGILEIRVDKFRRIDADYVRESIKLRGRLRRRLILTIRRRAEGGDKAVPLRDKIGIFEQNISRVDLVDIELRSPALDKVVGLARENKKKAIVSWHNFRSTPSGRGLDAIFRRARARGAHIVKIAARANSGRDLLRLAEWTYAHRRQKIITVSMGRLGAVSRLLFPVLGSLWTYTYIDRASAPGQVPLDILARLSTFALPNERL